MKTFNGIGIQHKKSGRIYSLDGWERKDHNPDEARGIAIGDGTHSLCLYKNAGKGLTWSSDEECLIPGVYTTEDIRSAMDDFHGKENTEAVLKAVSDGLIKNAPAFRWVRKMYGRDAYLPAAGELVMIVKKKNEIAECSDSIGGNLREMFGSNLWRPWTSTQYSANLAWNWHCNYSRLYSSNKSYSSSYSDFYALGCVAL